MNGVYIHLIWFHVIHQIRHEHLFNRNLFVIYIPNYIYFHCKIHFFIEPFIERKFYPLSLVTHDKVVYIDIIRVYTKCYKFVSWPYFLTPFNQKNRQNNSF